MKYKNFPNGRDEIVYESYDGGSHNGFHDFRIFLDGETSAVFAYKPQEEWSGLLSGDKIRNSAAPIQNMLNNGSFRRQVYLSNSDSFTDTVKKELSSYTANHKEDSIVTGEHHVIVRNYPL